jgi:hypothetical protein
MNHQQKLKLNEMINQYNTIDNTEEIKKLKHSKKIREDINKMVSIKKELLDDKKEIDIRCQYECFFLFKNYTNIYNKILKDDLDLNIMHTFLDTLESIENGDCDQHEASYKIGLLLKQIYIDKKINTKLENENETQTSKRPVNNITWKEYKQLKLD